MSTMYGMSRRVFAVKAAGLMSGFDQNKKWNGKIMLAGDCTYASLTSSVGDALGPESVRLVRYRKREP